MAIAFDIDVKAKLIFFIYFAFLYDRHTFLNKFLVASVYSHKMKLGSFCLEFQVFKKANFLTCDWTHDGDENCLHQCPVEKY